MDKVGAEVGQKMRSAIKAKLLELNCYVDDELPDYIMVMVANRRNKAQMKEDLNLFLNTKTEAFVDWLHIVLKKLKEVTVTNPEVYKLATKRKSSDQEEIKVQKEKKFKKPINIVKKEENISLTDNLQIEAKQNKQEEKTSDDFDIPLLSEVNTSSEKDLEEIERKIRSVKSRLGILVDEPEVGQMDVTLHTNEYKRANNINLESSAGRDIEQTVSEDQANLTPERERRHSPITFQTDQTPPRKPSVLKRLGERISDRKTHVSNYSKREHRFKRRSSSDRNTSRKSSKNDRIRSRSNDRNRHGVLEPPKLKNKEVMSKIHVPKKVPEELEHEDELKLREVRSMVQVKPRVISSSAQQPNKNLLLKAVEEAHRSVSQSTNIKAVNLNGEIPNTRKLSHREKVKLRNIILAQVSREDSDTNDEEEKEFEYVPKPLVKGGRQELPEYVPSSRRESVDEPVKPDKNSKTRISAKARLDRRRSPSPIIFDKRIIKVSNNSNKLEVPDRLPVIHQPISLKNKETCKYWPNCRQGDKCEFIHPSTKCELFPNCQYREKCLYIHPSCKFGPSCTKKNCPYSHFNSTKLLNKLPVTQPQTCKFFPKCANITCPFYHPKLCRFGKYCKNKTDCLFSHLSIVDKSSLTWRSKV